MRMQLRLACAFVAWTSNRLSAISSVRGRCARALTTGVSGLFLICAGLSLSTAAAQAVENINMSMVLAGALKAAEGVKDIASKVALLTDIAALQAKSSDEASARATLARALREAASIQDTSKRCDLLEKMPRAMLGAGAPATADWSIEEFGRLIVSRKPGQGWFGVSIENFRKGSRGAETDSKSSNGAFVLSIDNGGPAEKAGIEDGDVIIGLQGAKVVGAHSYSTGNATGGSEEAARFRR